MNDLFNPCFQFLSYLRIQGAHRPQQLDLIRNDIESRPPADFANGYHRTVQRVDISANDAVNLGNQMASGENRIFGNMRGRRMPAFPENMNGESVCGGQPLSLVNSNLPRGEEWKDMGSEDRVYLWVLQNPFFAVTDKSGLFAIHNVPEGKYTIKAWNRKFLDVSQEVAVPKEGEVPCNLALK